MALCLLLIFKIIQISIYLQGSFTTAHFRRSLSGLEAEMPPFLFFTPPHKLGYYIEKLPTSSSCCMSVVSFSPRTGRYNR